MSYHLSLSSFLVLSFIAINAYSNSTTAQSDLTHNSNTEKEASFSPSFNCKAKLNSVEKMICGSQHLSEADNILANVYKEVVASRMSRYDCEKEKRKCDVIKNEVTDTIWWWLRARNECYNEQCVFERMLWLGDKLRTNGPNVAKQHLQALFDAQIPVKEESLYRNKEKGYKVPVLVHEVPARSLQNFSVYMSPTAPDDTAPENNLEGEGESYRNEIQLFIDKKMDVFLVIERVEVRHFERRNLDGYFDKKIINLTKNTILFDKHFSARDNNFYYKIHDYRGDFEQVFDELRLQPIQHYSPENYVYMPVMLGDLTIKLPHETWRKGCVVPTDMNYEFFDRKTGKKMRKTYFVLRPQPEKFRAEKKWLPAYTIRPKIWRLSNGELLIGAVHGEFILEKLQPDGSSPFLEKHLGVKVVDTGLVEKIVAPFDLYGTCAGKYEPDPQALQSASKAIYNTLLNIK